MATQNVSKQADICPRRFPDAVLLLLKALASAYLYSVMELRRGDCATPALHALSAVLCTPRWSIAGQSLTERPLSFTVVLAGTTPTAGLAASASVVSVGPPLWPSGPSRPAPWLASLVPSFRQVASPPRRCSPRFPRSPRLLRGSRR